jgi:hypothetical protein
MNDSSTNGIPMSDLIALVSGSSFMYVLERHRRIRRARYLESGTLGEVILT